MFITRGELGPENLGELKILAKYRQAGIMIRLRDIPLSDTGMGEN